MSEITNNLIDISTDMGIVVATKKFEANIKSHVQSFSITGNVSIGYTVNTEEKTLKREVYIETDNCAFQMEENNGKLSSVKLSAHDSGLDIKADDNPNILHVRLPSGKAFSRDLSSGELPEEFQEFRAEFDFFYDYYSLAVRSLKQQGPEIEQQLREHFALNPLIANKLPEILQEKFSHVEKLGK